MAVAGVGQVVLSEARMPRAVLDRAAVRAGDDSFVLRPLLTPPCDPLIRNLFGDFRVPFLLLSTDVGLPVDMLVVNLLDLLNSLHEPREFFK